MNSWFTGCMLGLCALVCSGTAYADNSSLYYILDGSGSMWGRVDGKPKIEAAKNVMSELVNGMPADLNAGLIVYGHRRKGDCSDIEEVIPLGILDKQAALTKIKQVSPRGKTPISDSIVKAADVVKGSEEAATIVLVSDGIETCSKDPCALTKSLRESGAKFVLHVVGFGIQENDVEQLACIAEAGGGKFYQSRSADQLLSALKEVQNSVVEKKPLPKAPVVEPEPEPAVVKQEVAKTTSSIRIKAKGPGRIAFEKPAWLKEPYYWKLVDPESGEEKGKFRGLETQPVAPGDYQLVWHQLQHKSSDVVMGEVFTIESGKTTTVPLLTSVRFLLPDWVKEPYFWELRDANSGERMARFQTLDPEIVPSGTYELVWCQTQHESKEVSFGAITLQPDQENTIEMTTAVNLVRADWVPEKVYRWGLRKVGDSSGDWAVRYSRHFGPQLVPPGEYLVVYEMAQHKSSESVLGTVAVEEGKLNEISINTGVKLIPQAGMKEPYRVEFVELDNSGNEVRTVWMSRSLEPMALQPGTYRVKYHQDQHTSSKMTIVDSFDLPAGSLVEIEL
ncbi:MAG: VWA domain-containing protein [Bdellovibrionales bacterium]|nr:VWA domain-containing protein [Bdellovibrionales bacterium]